MLLFGVATPLTDVRTAEKERETSKGKNVFFFSLSKTFCLEGASLSKLPVTKASRCQFGQSEYPDSMILNEQME